MHGSSLSLSALLLYSCTMEAAAIWWLSVRDFISFSAARPFLLLTAAADSIAGGKLQLQLAALYEARKTIFPLSLCSTMSWFNFKKCIFKPKTGHILFKMWPIFCSKSLLFLLVFIQLWMKFFNEAFRKAFRSSNFKTCFCLSSSKNTLKELKMHFFGPSIANFAL